MIICESAKNEQESLKPKNTIDVIGLQVHLNTSSIKKGLSPFTPAYSDFNVETEFFIELPSIKKTFRFSARNSMEKGKWVDVFEQVQHANKYKTEIIRTNIGQSAPKWIPDEMCQYCCECNSEFTAINRRHHCRFKIKYQSNNFFYY